MRRIALLIVLALLPLAGAVPESEASQVDPRLAAVWHNPDVPQPGQQWTGGVRLVDGHNVTQVLYQICRVGESCFAPPTPAIQQDVNSWSFDTNDYRDPVQDQPVAWGINLAHEDGDTWAVGVQYFFQTADNEPPGDAVPAGIKELPPSDCTGECWIDWSASHYFVFTMPATTESTDRGAPGPGLLAIIGGLLVARARSIAVTSRTGLE